MCKVVGWHGENHVPCGSGMEQWVGSARTMSLVAQASSAGWPYIEVLTMGTTVDRVGTTGSSGSGVMQLCAMGVSRMVVTRGDKPHV